MASRQKSVLIVGRGIIGLTTAVELKKKGFQNIKLVAALGTATDALTSTASGVAGGLWYPFVCAPEEKTSGWSVRTLRRLCDEMQNKTALLEPMPGCSIGDRGIPSWVSHLQRTDPDLASWVGFHGNVRDTEELAQLLAQRVSQKLGSALEATAFAHLPSFSQASGCFVFWSIVVDAERYLQQLEGALGQGVEVLPDATLTSREEVMALARAVGCSLVVNCTGNSGERFGAKSEVIEEGLVTPTRGVLAIHRRERVDPAHNFTMLIHDNETDSDNENPSKYIKACYVIPRNDIVVCGGCVAENDLRPAAGPEEQERLARNWCLLTGARDVQSSLKSFAVGWRPSRKIGVRCEVEERPCPGGTRESGEEVLWAHNYGHGGAGWTLCWGCAEEIAQKIADKCQRAYPSRL